jgi:aminoglycoside phosphotransferase (APT) family kinase protein
MFHRADVGAVDKDRPSHEWIEQLRQAFPCEREIDRILVRKLKRRAGPPYAPVTLGTLVEGVQALLRSKLSDSFEILDERWLSGGASKLQMAFTLAWTQPGVGRVRTPMVLRMEPSESVVETSRHREFQLIQAFAGCLPVPLAHWVDVEGTFLPYPAIVYEFASGVTKPAHGTSGVSGLGTNYGAALRPILAPQFVQHLALIHTFDWREADLSAFDVPSIGIEAAEWQLNWWERVWEEDSHEDVPLMRLAMSWMRSNMPHNDKISVIHADYRSGNFLYNEDDNKISAWLDWELGHLGDRHEDIAWVSNTVFGHYAEDEKTFLVCGLMPEEEFYSAYEKASGLSVNRKSIKFYQLFNAYKCVVLSLATGSRIARLGKTHQDILVAWLVGIGYPILDQMQSILEEVI